MFIRITGFFILIIYCTLQMQASQFTWTENGKEIQAEVLLVLDKQPDLKRNASTNFPTYCQNTGQCALIRQVNKDQSTQYFHIDDHVFIQIEQSGYQHTIQLIEETFQLKCVNCDQTKAIHTEERTFIFKSEKNLSGHIAEVIQALNTGSTPGVSNAYPNRIDFFEPNMVNDFYLTRSWFILNQQQRIFCYGDEYMGNEVQLGIDKVWQRGYTGKDIKIGVIDFHGFEFTHPDMDGQFIDGWNGITNSSYTAKDYQANSQAHGMAVAGIIAAKANNHEGSAGIAHGAKIVPMLIDGSEISVIRVLQQAGPDGFNLDLINMSFSQYGYSQAIADEIRHLYKNGRVVDGNPKGTLAIASYGNDNQNDSQAKPFPAGMDEVLAVGASTPDDFLKQKGDHWDNGSSWGSNYGEHLDVIAPGVCIFTTDFSGNSGYVSGQDFFGFERTSAAAPVVTGIAALILDAEPLLSATQLAISIKQNAEKVQPDFYDYQNGKSLETGYGRVNAWKSLEKNITQVNPVKNSPLHIHSLTMNHQHLRFEYNGEYQGNSFMVLMYDFTGKLLLKKQVTVNQTVEISHNLQLSNALYLISIQENNSNNRFSQKIPVLN